MSNCLIPRATTRRGPFDLAIRHLNFADLEWHSEMVCFTKPVEHKAQDGLDYHCKFASRLMRPQNAP